MRQLTGPPWNSFALIPSQMRSEPVACNLRLFGGTSLEPISIGNTSLEQKFDWAPLLSKAMML